MEEKRRRGKFRYSRQDVATAAGISLAAVVKGFQRNKLDFGNLSHVADFIVRARHDTVKLE